MDFSLKANIMVCGAVSFLKKAQAESMLFDIIFMDPPYHTDDLEKVMAFLAEHDMVTTNGIIVIEHFHKKELPHSLLHSLRQKIYRYGDTSVSVFKRED
jgi:16S rRNA G966 N2-methylase RsmD